LGSKGSAYQVVQENAAAVWRDAPNAATVQRLYDSRTATHSIGAGGNAVFPSLKHNAPKPTYPSIVAGGVSAKDYTANKYASDESNRSLEIKGGGKMRPNSANVGSYARRNLEVDGIQPKSARDTDATSIIDRVVNYGKDVPAYLRPKGSGRAQSAGHQRVSDYIGGHHSSDSRNKQLAMMYAEELIEKLDTVILK